MKFLEKHNFQRRGFGVSKMAFDIYACNHDLNQCFLAYDNLKKREVVTVQLEYQWKLSCTAYNNDRSFLSCFVSAQETSGVIIDFLPIYGLLPNCQKATALAAATFRESTPWDIGMHTV